MAEMFTNSFENGMNKDYSPLLQPQGTYTHMVDCTLITQDGNNYTVKDCIGNLLTFTINTPYDAVYNAIGLPPMPLAFISFPNRLIVLSTNNEDDNVTGYLEIGEIKYLPYGEGIQPYSVAGEYNAGYVPLYHSANLNGNKMYRIEGIAMPEGQQTERIYWTDNNNQPRVFNTADPTFTTYKASGSLSATAGIKYMVLEGAIQYSGTVYGPGLTAGNIITTAGGVTTYTNLTPAISPKVIEYVDYRLFDWTPQRQLGQMTFDGYGVGSVNCGSKIYFFRYGISADGYFTPFSYPSAPINVNTDNNVPAINNYTDIVGAGTPTTLIASDYSVKIRVDNIDTKYDIIQLAVAEFDQLIDVPRSTSIVAQENISPTDTEIVLEHTGSTTLADVTIEDLTLFPASIEKVKTLDTNKNYLLVGNITEREELDLPYSLASDVTLTSFEYQLPSYPLVESLASFEVPEVSAQGNANPTTNIVPESHWVVTDDNSGADPVEYPVGSGTFYSQGETFVGLDTFDSATIAAGAAVRPCIVKNKFTTNAAVDVKEIIQMKNDYNFWDYKDPLVHQELTGYWSTETYRFGVLFYDLKGNPFYVRHIGDFAFPNNNSKGGLTVAHEYQTVGVNDFYCLNPSGLNVSGLTIPASEIDKISGFSIVRAIRDPRVIAQGLVTQCSWVAGAPDVIYPGAYIPISYDLNGAVPSVREKAYCLLSPDLMCDVPLKGQIGVEGDIMESAQWLDCVTLGGQYTNTFVAAPEDYIISKPLISLTADTTLRESTITSWFNVLEREVVGTGVNDNFQNQSFTTVAATPSGLNNGAMVGGKKVFFTLEDDFLHYGPSVNNYTSNAANGMQEKLLMNYVKASFGTPYGGQSESSLANTVYISTGHYQEINATVKSQTVVGSEYVFNNIEVWGGDCFTNMIDYGYGLWDDAYSATFTPYSYAWRFPCECNSNYNLRRGRKETNVGLYSTVSATADAIIYFGPASQVRLEQFQYNQGYSTEGQPFLYPALPANFVNNNLFKARVRYAGPKFINEINDSFRTFLLNDYKDLDVLQGGINCIKVKEGRVFVWQDLALNTVPVLERQILSGLPGAVTTLGTGGVVDRFDPISTYFGTQHQWSVIPTEYGFAYFDMRHKAFMVLDQSLNEASFVGGMNSFFSEAFNEMGNQASVVDSDLLLNSPTFAPSSDRPLIGVGITGVYDPKFKLTYMTFKFYTQRKIGGTFNDIVNQSFTIVYYHPKKMFMGFSTFMPAIAHNHNSWVLASNDPKNITKYYGVDMVPTTFSVGDTVPLDNVEYICIQDVAIDQFPPSDVDKTPDYVGSVYWEKVNSTDQVWVSNQPNSLTSNSAPDYIYNSIFGKATTGVLEFIVNPRVANPFSVLSIEQEGNRVNVTKVETFGNIQSAADSNISSTNKWYRVIYDKICSNLPLSSTGRITDSYLKIRLTKKNWTTDPTSSTGFAVRLLRFVNSFYEQKR